MPEEMNGKKTMETKDAEIISGPEETLVSPDERMLGMLCVLSQFLSYFSGFGGLIVPLIIWLLKRDSSKFIDQVGKETVNFQITLLILAVIGAILCVILIGGLLLFLLGIYSIVTTIIAAVKANEGVVYRYPVCFRFIK